jgi:hypothetical protein
MTRKHTHSHGAKVAVVPKHDGMPDHGDHHYDYQKEIAASLQRADKYMDIFDGKMSLGFGGLQSYIFYLRDAYEELKDLIKKEVVVDKQLARLRNFEHKYKIQIIDP